MKKLVYFLGSVYFAVGLISTSALIVILGTFVESWSGSHQFAAHLAYRNPVFLFLLSLFFVNILVSALRRWPFQRKHIPFLITHLGLLMIIAGVMLKNCIGVQGQMGLIEGAASDTIIIPETYRVQVQKPGAAPQQFSLKESEVVQYYPHSKQLYETWIKGNFAYLDGIKPFPVYTFDGNIEPASRMKIPNDRFEHWDLYAYFADDALEVAKKVYLEGLKVRLTERKTGALLFEGDPEVQWDPEPTIIIPPTIAADLFTTPKLLFVKEKSGDTHFFAFDAFGQFFHKLFSGTELTHYIAYDQGFAGYGVQVNVPLPMERKEREKIQWESVSETEKKGCAWGALLLNQLKEGEDLRQQLKNWPLASLMDSITDPNALITALLQQVLMIADELPDPPEECSAEQMLAVYFMAYSIQGKAQMEEMHFECPLTVRHEPLPPLKKLEENRPMIVLKINNDYQTLSYDPYGLGLSWPRGESLYSFRAETKKIPHKIRLRDARQINYPGEEQAYSYESDLLIDQTIEKTVSMNEVYETADGYRFYLSNIYPHEEIQAQRIQLVVNRDPVKYWLTYPGGLIVALGVMLLFWRNR